MRQVAADFKAKALNPLDVAEDIILSQDWEFERRGDAEMVAEVPGRWCDFGLLMAWSPEMGVLHVSCSLDLKIGDNKKPEVFELLAKANEKLWIGHFSLWTDKGIPIFRHSLLVDNKKGVDWERLADLIEISIEECERFYPAFQYVIWGGKSVNEAINSAMIETVGRA